MGRFRPVSLGATANLVFFVDHKTLLVCLLRWADGCCASIRAACGAFMEWISIPNGHRNEWCHCRELPDGQPSVIDLH